MCCFSAEHTALMSKIKYWLAQNQVNISEWPADSSYICVQPNFCVVRVIQHIFYRSLYTFCQWLAAGRWFSLCTSVSSTNKTDGHDKAEILLNVALSSITPTQPLFILAIALSVLRFTTSDYPFDIFRLFL